MSDELNKTTHIRYALRHLRMLPPPYQSDDSNRITFGFFALSSLAILGALDRLDQQERDDYIDWIYRSWDDESGGFGGAPKQELRPSSPDEPSYDQAHLTHTYTALLILALLTVPTSEEVGLDQSVSPYRKLNFLKLLSFVSNCQRPNGSFGSFPTSSDEDVRFVYCAIAILKMVRITPSTVIDVGATVAFLKSCRRYEGGYGQYPYAEAQGGTTYCAVASLAMLNQLEQCLTEDECAKTLRWLVDRQVEFTDLSMIQEEGDGDDAPPLEAKNPAHLLTTPVVEHSLETSIDNPPLDNKTVAGFQGRIGKPLDACYSFWCTASLAIMTKLLHPQHKNCATPPSLKTSCQDNPISSTASKITPTLYDPEANIRFLLLCQSKQWGGIARSPEDHPDVYHTYLALASLSLSHRASLLQQQGDSSKGNVQEEVHQTTEGVDEFLSEHDPLLNVPSKVSNWIDRCFGSS